MENVPALESDTPPVGNGPEAPSPHEEKVIPPTAREAEVPISVEREPTRPIQPTTESEQSEEDRIRSAQEALANQPPNEIKSGPPREPPQRGVVVHSRTTFFALRTAALRQQERRADQQRESKLQKAA